MRDDVITILDDAVAHARAAGLDVEGWTMQSGADGYVAWLYREDEEGQSFLFSEVDIYPDAVDAARACLARTRQAPVVEPEGVAED